MFAHQFMTASQLGDSQPGMLTPAGGENSDSSEDRPGNYL